MQSFAALRLDGLTPIFIGGRNFDDSVTIMARIRLARMALAKLQKAIFGTRRVALESKKIAYESLVLFLLLYGSECWVVSAENTRLL